MYTREQIEKAVLSKGYKWFTDSKNKGYDVIRSHTNSIHFHEGLKDNSKTIAKLKNHGLAFKSGDISTGTPVKIPGDKRETWIRLSVGPKINEIIEKIL